MMGRNIRLKGIIWKIIFTRFKGVIWKIIPRLSLMSLFIWNTEQDTVELQWLEHPWYYEYLFETGVVRANEGLL